MDATHESLLAVMEKVARQLLVAVQRVRRSPENPTAPQRAIDQAASGKCLACDGKDQPEKSGLRRGQCDNCYPKTLRRLKDGKLNETTLIEAGKMLPATPGGRRGSSFSLDDLQADSASVDDLLKGAEGKKKVRSTVQRKGAKTKKPAAKTT